MTQEVPQKQSEISEEYLRNLVERKATPILYDLDLHKKDSQSHLELFNIVSHLKKALLDAIAYRCRRTDGKISSQEDLRKLCNEIDQPFRSTELMIKKMKWKSITTNRDIKEAHRIARADIEANFSLPSIIRERRPDSMPGRPTTPSLASPPDARQTEPAPPASPKPNNNEAPAHEAPTIGESAPEAPYPNALLAEMAALGIAESEAQNAILDRVFGLAQFLCEDFFKALAANEPGLTEVISIQQVQQMISMFQGILRPIRKLLEEGLRQSDMNYQLLNAQVVAAIENFTPRDSDLPRTVESLFMDRIINLMVAFIKQEATIAKFIKAFDAIPEKYRERVIGKKIDEFLLANKLLAIQQHDWSLVPVSGGEKNLAYENYQNLPRKQKKDLHGAYLHIAKILNNKFHGGLDVRSVKDIQKIIEDKEREKVRTRHTSTISSLPPPPAIGRAKVSEEAPGEEALLRAITAPPPEAPYQAPPSDAEPIEVDLEYEVEILEAEEADANLAVAAATPPLAPEQFPQPPMRMIPAEELQPPRDAAQAEIEPVLDDDAAEIEAAAKLVQAGVERIMEVTEARVERLHVVNELFKLREGLIEKVKKNAVLRSPSAELLAGFRTQIRAAEEFLEGIKDDFQTLLTIINNGKNEALKEAAETRTEDFGNALSIDELDELKKKFHTYLDRLRELDELAASIAGQRNKLNDASQRVSETQNCVQRADTFFERRLAEIASGADPMILIGKDHHSLCAKDPSIDADLKDLLTHVRKAEQTMSLLEQRRKDSGLVGLRDSIAEAIARIDAIIEKKKPAPAAATEVVEEFGAIKIVREAAELMPWTPELIREKALLILTAWTDISHHAGIKPTDLVEAINQLIPGFKKLEKEALVDALKAITFHDPSKEHMKPNIDAKRSCKNLLILWKNHNISYYVPTVRGFEFVKKLPPVTKLDDTGEARVRQFNKDRKTRLGYGDKKEPTKTDG